ncbi:MAG: hypothetical protein IPM29_09940 [Planctomycetes bacterium]|nr:hypothetical protein [Planctomycetota bacterium]
MSHNPFLPIVATALALLAATQVTAQYLRQGIAHAEHVCVARHVGVQPLGNDLFVHRYRTLEVLAGTPAESFSILEHKRVADTPTPQPGPDRLLCLVADHRTPVPERFAPVYRTTGFAGDRPVADDSPEFRSLHRLAEVLIAATGEARLADTTTALLQIVTDGQGPARREACEALRERPALRDRLSPVARDQILQLAVAEAADLPLKMALASLAVDAGVADAVPSLCLALGTCDDPRFARCLGQLAALRHGDGATAVLMPFLRSARGPLRARLLRTLGATRTTSALDQLLELYRTDADPAPVAEALREHGAPRALEALR